MGAAVKSGVTLALVGAALCAAMSLAAADDRSICGAAPPKSDTIMACTRVIASARTSAHDRALAFAFRADAQRASGDLADAIADDSDALSLLPNLIPALNSRGIAYRETAKYDLALADFNAAINLLPDNAEL